MKIGFVIYNGMTTLDFIGVYDPLVRLKTMGFMKDVSWDICAHTKVVTDGAGLELKPTIVDKPLNQYDIVIVPGGFETKQLLQNNSFINWIKTASSCKLKVSVCTGGLIFGVAGFLKGKKATTHPTMFNELSFYCDKVVKQRIVDEGDVITAGGVTSAIDLGLYLCEKFAGEKVKIIIQKQMDYLQT